MSFKYLIGVTYRPTWNDLYSFVMNVNYRIASKILFVIFSRSLESQLFNKANELQEDISMKRFDQRVALIHLAAVKAQVNFDR